MKLSLYEVIALQCFVIVNLVERSVHCRCLLGIGKFLPVRDYRRYLQNMLLLDLANVGLHHFFPFSLNHLFLSS